MGGHNLDGQMHSAYLKTDKSYLRTPSGRMIYCGSTDPTASSNMAPGSLYIDTANAVTKYNSGTAAVPVWSSITGSSSNLAQSTTIEAGTYDVTLATTTQTSSAPTLTIPDCAGTSQNIVLSAATQTLTNKTLTAPTITGGTAQELTTFSIRDSGVAYDLLVASNDNTMAADRTLTIDVNNSNRTIDLSGNLVLGGTLTTAGAITHSGAHAITLATSGTTDLDLPTGGSGWEIMAFDASSEAQGDVLVRGATDWAVLAVGSNGQVLTTDGTDVSWGNVTTGTAGTILDGCTLSDAGALDATLSFTQQTSSAPTLTIPDMAGTSTSFAFLGIAQTWTAAQTFGKADIQIMDTDESHDTIITNGSALSADRTLTLTHKDANSTLTFANNFATAGDYALTLTTTNTTNVTLPTTGTLATVGGALGAADIVGGTATALESLSVNDASTAAYDMLIAANCTSIGADRTLTFDIGNANRTVQILGDVALSGNLSLVGDDALTLNTSAATTITLPTSGTLINTTGALDGGSVLNATSLGVADNSGAGSYELQFICSSTFAASDRTLTFVPGDASRSITMAGNINVSGDFITSGDDSVTLTTSAATNVTLPTSGTLATVAGTETFTNKTFDCDGTGNALSNINVNELDPTTIDGTTATAVPFIIHKTFTNLDNAGTDIYTDNCPFKLKVLDAYIINTSANGGDWQLNKGKVGALGSAIIVAQTIAATDTLMDRAIKIDDAQYEIAANGSLVAVGDAGATLDCIMVITCIRSD